MHSRTRRGLVALTTVAGLAAANPEALAAACTSFHSNGAEYVKCCHDGGCTITKWVNNRVVEVTFI